jgi:hypothetical protein
MTMNKTLKLQKKNHISNFLGNVSKNYLGLVFVECRVCSVHRLCSRIILLNKRT